MSEAVLPIFAPSCWLARAAAGSLESLTPKTVTFSLRSLLLCSRCHAPTSVSWSYQIPTTTTLSLGFCSGSCLRCCRHFCYCCYYAPRTGPPGRLVSCSASLSSLFVCETVSAMATVICWLHLVTRGSFARSLSKYPTSVTTCCP